MKNSTVCAVFFLLAAALFARTACPLDGTKWKLTEWTLSSIDPKDVIITLNFAGGKISGSGGVNSYGGNCEAKADGSFSAGEISSTLMAGPEPAMRAEAAYFKLLGGARAYKIKGDTLTLYDGDGNESLIFTKENTSDNKLDPPFTVHGRLKQYLGGNPYAIWVIGTKRYLAVNQSATEVFDMPNDLRDMFAPNSPGDQRCYEQEIYADFLVQAFTPYKEGEMQIVRIISANKIMLTENGKIILKKKKL